MRELGKLGVLFRKIFKKTKKYVHIILRSRAFLSSPTRQAVLVSYNHNNNNNNNNHYYFHSSLEWALSVGRVAGTDRSHSDSTSIFLRPIIATSAVNRLDLFSWKPPAELYTEQLEIKSYAPVGPK